VWVVPALVVLVRDGRWRWAAGAYLLFCLSPLWWTPREYGFHGVVTVVANCYLLSGLAFVGYMAWRLRRRMRTSEPEHPVASAVREPMTRSADAVGGTVTHVTGPAGRDASRTDRAPGNTLRETG
jgi:alpha-1,2-mannosyltransferase